jgi:hypothetical protein
MEQNPDFISELQLLNENASLEYVHQISAIAEWDRKLRNIETKYQAIQSQIALLDKSISSWKLFPNNTNIKTFL